VSFKVAISDVRICNEALALLPQAPIVSLAENSPEAGECKRSYKSVVAEMLEAYHWGLASKRVTLAQIVNARPSEWGYAYAKPADMAYPVAMLWNGGGAWGWGGGNIGWLGGHRIFEQVGDTIYSHVPAAQMEYTSFDITEANFTALFKRIVVLELAARICWPITKSDARARLLMTQAENERQRAIANDINRNRPTYGNSPTEGEMVRFGGMGDVGGFGVSRPLDPVADPIGATLTPDGAPPGEFYYEG
jgi:hypothetical protein